MRVFPGRRDQVARARDFVAHVLSGTAAVDEAVLMTSEVATNAVVHTSSGNNGTFAVLVFRDPRIRVEVWDGGAEAAPVADPPGRDGESGAGLGLVELLAHRWGYNGGPSGRVVWFEILQPSGDDHA
jgi:anti-sigma regulatory factor (Ser/Thr protein kinase)